MNKHQICITAAANIESLPSSNCYNLDLNTGLHLEDGEHVIEEAGLLGRGGG